MPAIVLSHSSFALSHNVVFMKVSRHWSMLKKAASRSARASLKSSSSPPKFVKNEILATSLIHTCIGVRPFVEFFLSFIHPVCFLPGERDDCLDVVWVVRSCFIDFSSLDLVA